MELSDRLSAVAELVTGGFVVADIGTDHGYIPIHLVMSGKSPRAIAMDINSGPLLRAQQHIAAHQLEPYIETRASDGLNGLKPGEAQSVVMAGMGGGLVIKILSQSPLVAESVKEFILQPQSEISAVREFLNRQGFAVWAENMVFEDGKYYPMMSVEWGNEPPLDEVERRYGRCLLQNRHPVLRKFLLREVEIKEQLINQLGDLTGDGVKKRREEINQELSTARSALERMKV